MTPAATVLHRAEGHPRPAETRWKAFRTGRPFDAGAVQADRRVYGVWSLDGSLWQAVKFLIPLIGIIAIMVDSTGVLHR